MLIGDAKCIVGRLLDKLTDVPDTAFCSVWRTTDPPRPTPHNDAEEALGMSAAVPIEPARLKTELSRMLPDDAVVCADAGGSYLNMGLVHGRRGQTFYSEASWSSMGQMTAG